MATYITKSKLDEYLLASGLPLADADLVVYVVPLLKLANGAPYNGIINSDQDATAVATALGISVSDLYKVAKLAVAAGYLVQV